MCRTSWSRIFGIPVSFRMALFALGACLAESLRPRGPSRLPYDSPEAAAAAVRDFRGPWFDTAHGIVNKEAEFFIYFAEAASFSAEPLTFDEIAEVRVAPNSAPGPRRTLLLLLELRGSWRDVHLARLLRCVGQRGLTPIGVQHCRHDVDPQDIAVARPDDAASWTRPGVTPHSL